MEGSWKNTVIHWGNLGERWGIRQSYATHSLYVGATGPFEHKVSICSRVLSKMGVEAGEAGRGHIATALIQSGSWDS